MTQRLLLIGFVFISSCCLSQGKYRDFLHGTEIHYEIRETSAFSALYGGRDISLHSLVINGEDSTSFKNLNKNIYDATLELLTSEKYRQELMTYYHESIPFRSRFSIPGNLPETPHILRSSSDVLALCNDILVVSLRIEYSGKGLGGYSCLRYFDMKTNNEIDKTGFIRESEKTNFESLVKKRIPEEYKDLVSEDEIKNGDAFFVGAGFYYILQGSMNNPMEGFCGIPSVYVRFSLSEIQHMLAEEGFLGSYKNHKPGTKQEKMLQEFTIPVYTMFSGDYYYLRQDPRQIFHGPGVRKATCYNDSSKMKMFEYYFDTEGKVTLQINHETIPHSDRKDSLAFSYHPNGHLQSVREFKNTLYSGEKKRCAWFFDDSGNLCKQIQYGDDYEISASHYTYIDSLVLVDSYNKRNGIHYFSSCDIYEFQYGQLLTRGRHDEDLLEFSAQEKDGDIEISEYGKPLISFDYQNGKLFSYSYYKKKYTFQYNASGDPVLFENTRQYSDEIEYRLSVEYNNRRLPIMFTLTSDWRNVNYIIMYE